MLWVLLVCYFLFCFAGGVLSQTKDAKSLRREDIAVRRNGPTIYLCADPKTEKNKKERDSDVVWLSQTALGGVRLEFVDILLPFARVS